MDKTKIFFLLSLVGFTLFLLAFSDAVFFWDTVSQASKRGNFYYETGFQQLLLDPDLDSGHPPFFNLFIGLSWTIFGRTLLVSHLVMLPFVLGIVYQIYLLIKHLFRPKYRWLVFLIAIADTTFLAQSILISPDIVMLFGFLLCLNGIWEGKKWKIIIGSFLMPFVSIRGILLTMVTALIYFLTKYREVSEGKLKTLFESIGQEKKPFWSSFFNASKLTILLFLPVGICLIGYLFYHFQATGWWISSPNPKWVVHRQTNDFYNIARNIGLMGWRFLDNGRIICSLLLLLLFFRKFAGLSPHKLTKSGRPSKLARNKSGQFIFLSLFSFFLVFGPIFIFFSVAINNRYLLPAFLLLHLLVVWLILDKKIGFANPKPWLFAVLIALLSGSFWVYPKHIAQGWDGTLAHLPYYQLREQLLDFIDKENIPLEQIGTEFPCKGKLDFYDLSNRTKGLADKDFEKNKYIFYATVMNDFTDEELRALDEDWTIVKAFRQWPIEVILYKNPKE